MDLKKDDLILAFENSNRNKNIKLFDYYQEWFANKDFLSYDIVRKINVELGITVSRSTVHYIRSKVMPKRLEELKNNSANSKLIHTIFRGKTGTNSLSNSTSNFEFQEPKSIDHNQEIVTIRKSKK